MWIFCASCNQIATPNSAWLIKSHSCRKNANQLIRLHSRLFHCISPDWPLSLVSAIQAWAMVDTYAMFCWYPLDIQARLLWIGEIYWISVNFDTCLQGVHNFLQWPLSPPSLPRNHHIIERYHPIIIITKFYWRLKEFVCEATKHDSWIQCHLSSPSFLIGFLLSKVRVDRVNY